MPTDAEYLCCPVCGPDRLAELPGEDAHEAERLCADCGAAVFLDPPMLVLVSAGSAA